MILHQPSSDQMVNIAHFARRPLPNLDAEQDRRFLRLWRYPGFSNSAFNNVTLNPLASRASERSQVMAQRARLNRRQLHRRTASGALRTLVLRVEQVSLPSVRNPELPGKPLRGN